MLNGKGGRVLFGVNDIVSQDSQTTASTRVIYLYAKEFLYDHVPIAGQVVTGKMQREDYPMYAPLATREALTNAVCHC